MSAVIKTHFEPDILGATHIWCTQCGEVTQRDHIQYVFDNLFIAHNPVCACGESDVIGEVIDDGLTLKMKGEITLYPRRDQNGGKKPLPMVWDSVAPYRTKKGTMCSVKPNRESRNAQGLLYDRFQERISVMFTAEDLEYPVFENLFNLFDRKVSLGVAKIAMKNGLVVLSGRRHWAGPRKLTWLKDKKQGWVDVKMWEDCLNETGYSLNRGGLVEDRDSAADIKVTASKKGSATVGCNTYWYDPSESKYVLVADQQEGWCTMGYDEAQGSDDDKDEDDHIVEACGANIDSEDFDESEEEIEADADEDSAVA